MHRPVRSPPPRLTFITDGVGDGERVLRLCRAALAGGADCVQLREPGLAPRDLYALACALRAACVAHGARLLVNDRIDVALACEAHGAHVGARSLPAAQARSLLPGRYLSVAAHDAGELAAAAAAGADSATLSPVFATRSHPGAPALGVARAAELVQAAALPVVWLGGIAPSNIALLRPYRPAGIAVIRALSEAADPAVAAAALLAALA